MATQTIHFVSFPQCDGVKLFAVGSDTVVASGASVAMGTNDSSAGTCTVTDVAAGLYKVVCFMGSTALSYQYVDLELATDDFYCRDSIEGDTRISSRAAPGAEMALVDDAITASKYDETTAYPIKSADSGSTAIARTGADGDTLETLSDQLDTAQSDLDLITGDDGVTLATSQEKYAPAKDGAKMDLVDAPNAAAVTALQNGVSTFDPTTDTVARVTLVDTCTANTDMRGTDNAVTSLSGIATATDVADAAQDVINAIPDVSGLALETTAQSIKTKTDAIPSASDIATAVWSASTRTLSSFETLVADVATAVWSATTRTLSGFSHKVTVEANEDKAGYSLETSPPTKEAIATQVRTELATELGLIDAAVSSRLAPTTAGRTLNVEEDGTILTTAEVSEESIRNAVGLEDGKRVATPEDVNITIGSVQATVNDRGEGFQIRQFVGEVFPCVVLGVTDGAGPVDLSGYEDLRLILQDRCGADVQVVEHDAITVFGDDSNSFSWTPSADLVSKARRIEGALWEYKDGERFKVIITGSITIEGCPRKDEA